MSVWLCIPSARPVAEVNRRMAKWRAQGYKIALLRDAAPGWTVGKDIGRMFTGEGDEDLICDFILFQDKYRGYAIAATALIIAVMAIDPDAKWFVCAGDDTDPDPTKRAEEIARECYEHFLRAAVPNLAHQSAGTPTSALGAFPMSTFGVMQPTGDRWGDRQGAYIDRVAGSPWIGREFARRMYQGNGPYWPEYTHMGVDEELQAVAIKYGVFHQRPDLTHYHDHWGRPKPGEVLAQQSNMPAFLERANSPAEWDRYKAIFKARSAAGFPGSEPIA